MRRCQHTVQVTVVCNCGGSSIGERIGEAIAIGTVIVAIGAGRFLIGLPRAGQYRPASQCVSLAAERCSIAAITVGGLVAPEAMVAPTLGVAGLFALAQGGAYVWQYLTGRPLVAPKTPEVLRIPGNTRADRPELDADLVGDTTPFWQATAPADTTTK